MNKDTLERLHETVHVPHGDPQLVLYTKLVVGLLWLLHLPLGFLYGAPLPFYLLLGGMASFDLESFYGDHLSYFKSFFSKVMKAAPQYFSED
mgnify:CR=1 FL=1